MGELRVEFHQEMEDLRGDLIRLGAMVSETIGRGTAALLDRDLHAAQELIDGDDVIDDFCIELEERCCRLLALQSPIACTWSTWAPLRLRPPTSPDRRTPSASARRVMRPLARVAEAAVRFACASAAVPASARGGGGGGAGSRGAGAPAQAASRPAAAAAAMKRCIGIGGCPCW